MDENLNQIYGNSFKNDIQNQIKLNQLNINCFSFILKSGEKHKSLENIQNVLNDMFLKQFNRSDLIIGFGGGLITDFSGFTASIFMRGIQFISIPTTVLGISDAVIGGKTAVNHEKYGKNLIGSFYDPISIIVNTEYLKTLDDRNFANGMVEIIKIAMILDKQFFEQLLKYNQQDLRLEKNQEILTQIMKRSMELKEQVVKSDKKEANLRKILNFGHTIGHGIEFAGHESILHGEAVACGIIYALELSEKMGILQEDLQIVLQKTKQCFKNYNVPYQYPEHIEQSQIISYMSQDKKIMQSQYHFVLLESIGKAKTDTVVVPLNLVKSIISKQITVQIDELILKQKDQIIVNNIPGSKSITNRILIIAALQEKFQFLKIKNFLFSEDTEIMIQALEKIGSIKVKEQNQQQNYIIIEKIKMQNNQDHGNQTTEIFVGNSGTSARFLITYILSLNNDKSYKLYGIERMNQRPIKDLIIALEQNSEQKNVIFTFLGKENCFPMIVKSIGFNGGKIQLDSQTSSQYVTSILLSAPYSKKPVNLQLQSQNKEKLVSEDFIILTTDLMKQIGVKTERLSQLEFKIDQNQYLFQSDIFLVEPDCASMSYYLQAGFCLNKEVQIQNFNYENCLQGDKNFIKKLQQIGIIFEQKEETLILKKNQIDNAVQTLLKKLEQNAQENKILEFDFNDCTDTFITFSCIIGFLIPLLIKKNCEQQLQQNSEQFIVIKGIQNQRQKECDRIYAVSKNLLHNFGILSLISDGNLKININHFQNQDGIIKCYNDHRLAMAFSILSCSINYSHYKNQEKQHILDSKECVQKTFPQFWVQFYNQFGMQSIGNLDNTKKKIQDNQIQNIPPIFIVGMRGAGKTTLTENLGNSLNLKIVQTDDLILSLKAPQYKNLQDLIEDKGWLVFRQYESEVLQYLSLQRNIIVSTGGGIIESQENMNLLKAQKLVIWVQRDINEIQTFLENQNQDRPKLPGQKSVEEIYLQDRIDKYNQCCNYVYTIPNKQSIIKINQQNDKEYWSYVDNQFIKLIKNNIILKEQVEIPRKEGTYFVCLQLEDFYSFENDQMKMTLEQFEHINNNYTALEIRSDQYFQKHLIENQNIQKNLIMERYNQILSQIKYFVKIPLIFTLRTKKEGGQYTGDFKTYQYINKTVNKSSNNFTFIDIEYSSQQQSLVFLQNFKKNNKKIIFSKHYIDQNYTEDQVQTDIQIMLEYRKYFDILKICLNENHSENLLNTIRKLENTFQIQIIVIKLGINGKITRIQNNYMTPVSDSYLSQNAVIKGQVQKNEIINLRQMLNLDSNNTVKKVYLFGTQISLSYSPLIHNSAYKQLNQQSNLIFVKKQVSNYQEILECIQNDPQFLGACITMPFKEQLIPYIDQLHGEAKQVKIINTIIKFRGKLHGFNTDIYGITRPLQKKLIQQNLTCLDNTNKKQPIALLLGCGSTAGTVLFCLKKYFKFEKILIWNRTYKNLTNFINQQDNNSDLIPFENFKQIDEFLGNNQDQFDLQLLISSVPGSSQEIQQIEETKYIHSNKNLRVFDISYFPRDNFLKQYAKKNNLTVIEGIDMLLYQAFKQIQIFTGGLIVQRSSIKSIVKEAYYNDSYK